MEGMFQCQRCHSEVRVGDYFCFNCGENLRPKPLDTSVGHQLTLYVGSVVLLPMGLIWGMRYVRQSSGKAKTVGVVCIIITVVTVVILAKVTVNFMQLLNQQVEEQMGTMGL